MTVPAAAAPLTRDAVQQRASQGAPAAQILRESFPGVSLSRMQGTTVRVLVADLAPQVVLSGQTPLRLVDEGAPRTAPRLVLPGHRHLIVRRGAVITVRDLDDPRGRARRVTGPIRLDAGLADTGIRMAEPLGRRYRGSLRVAPSAERGLSVVNEVGLEAYLQGVLPGDMPPDWAAGALQAGAVAARSRVMAKLGATGAGRKAFHLTADDPLYLGLDGERPTTNRAVQASRGMALQVSRRPFEADFPVVPGTAPVVFLPDPGDPDPVAESPTRPVPGMRPGLAPQAVRLAMSFSGTPYVWGGSRPGGFDCSGLTYYVYGQLGIRLPRVAEDQARVGIPVPREQLRPGDLVFFADSSGYIGHMGMFIGNGKMLHAPQTGDVVRVADITTGSYARRYAGARRFSP
ncbi:MAG: NlpC/P60 family protein [Thermoleophilia bacterium]|nr:NlpC/P60 family protein [Thermoleophilia bacterium]